MPNPSAVKASDINTELGVSSTLEIKMGNNWVRNVTTQSTGAVTFGKARWGINFPGGDWGNAGSYYNKTYNLSANCDGTAYGSNPYGNLTIYSLIAVCSNGTIIYYTQENSIITNLLARTWLTSGSNSDYTARVDVTSGSISGTTGSDLSLSSTRVWSAGGEIAYTGYGNSDSFSGSGDLIIKDSGGTELFRRRINLLASGDTG